MIKYDLESAAVHKKVYWELWDKLDAEAIRKIVNDPQCPEAISFNLRVEERVKREKKPQVLAAVTK